MRKLSILNSLNQIDFGLFCPYQCAEITSNKCKYISKGSRDLAVGILLFGRGEGVRSWDVTASKARGDPFRTERVVQRDREPLAK